MIRPFLPRTTLLAAIAVIGCTDPTTNPTTQLIAPEQSSLSLVGGEQTYVLLADSTMLRESLVADVEAAGGNVVRALGRIGVIIATSSDPGFAAKAARISGVSAAVPDV